MMGTSGRLDLRRCFEIVRNLYIAFGRVADTQPHHGKTRTTTAHPLGKVFVLGDDHRAVFLGVPPDWSILALSEIDIQNVLGLGALFPATIGPGRRVVACQQ